MSVYIISEVCGQWGGSIDKAKRMIDESAESGADAVKVQIYDTYQMPGDNRSKWEYLSMSQEVFLELKEYSEKLGVDYFASAFHQDRFDWILNSGLKVNKIASMLIESDFDLCIKMLESGLKTYCSLGKWNKEHLPFKHFNNVDYLHCVCKYPHSVNEAIELMPENFDNKLCGYSDHSEGIDACKIAVDKGAKVLEKHFTLDKSLQSSTEAAHTCSMVKSELKDLRQYCGRN